MKDRNTIYKIILIMSIACTGLVIATSGLINKIAFLAIILLFAVNAGYGGGFSNLPTLLSDRFGMKSISSIHGIALSAWAIAGLTGNQMAEIIVSHSSSDIAGYQNLLYFTGVLYVIALAINFIFIKKPTKAVEI